MSSHVRIHILNLHRWPETLNLCLPQLWYARAVRTLKSLSTIFSLVLVRPNTSSWPLATYLDKARCPFLRPLWVHLMSICKQPTVVTLISKKITRTEWAIYTRAWGPATIEIQIYGRWKGQDRVPLQASLEGLGDQGSLNRWKPTWSAMDSISWSTGFCVKSNSKIWIKHKIGRLWRLEILQSLIHCKLFVEGSTWIAWWWSNILVDLAQLCMLLYQGVCVCIVAIPNFTNMHGHWISELETLLCQYLRTRNSHRWEVALRPCMFLGFII